MGMYSPSYAVEINGIPLLDQGERGFPHETVRLDLSHWVPSLL